jgi:hypothetical protein
VNQLETISDPPRRSRRIALREEAEANQADALEPPIQAPDVEQDVEQEPAPLIVQEEEQGAAPRHQRPTAGTCNQSGQREHHGRAT